MEINWIEVINWITYIILIGFIGIAIYQGLFIQKEIVYSNCDCINKVVDITSNYIIKGVN